MVHKEGLSSGREKMGFKILPIHFFVQDLLPTLLILEGTVGKQEGTDS